MDTKLRSIKYSNLFKTIAFLLIAVGLTSAALQIQVLALDHFNPESLITESYKDSVTFLTEDAYPVVDVVNQAFKGYEVETLGDQYYYYFVIGDKIFTNLASGDETFFRNKDSNAFVLENGEWTYDQGKTYPYGHSIKDKNAKAYFAFTADYMNKTQRIWSDMRSDAVPVFINLVSVIVMTLLLLVYLGVVIGRK